MAYKPVGVDENGMFPPRVQTALSTTYASKTGVTLVTAGDSLTYQAGVATSAVPSASGDVVAEPRGWQTWALAGLGQKLRWVKNAGIGGNTTTDLLARMQADVYAYNPDWVSVEIGRNDIFFTSDTAAVIMGRIQQIVSGCLVRGSRVALFTVSASGTDTTTQKATRKALNALIRDYARSTRGVVLVDVAATWTDPATEVNITEVVHGDLISSNPNVYDTTHASHTGATRWAKAFIDAVGPLVGGTSPRPDVASAYVTANPFLTGTTGGRDTGISGVSPDGWVMWNDGSGVAATGSKVARTDGIVGDWMQIEITTPGQVRLAHNGYTTGAGTAFKAGDNYVLELEYEVEGLVNPKQLSAQTYIGASGAVNSFVGLSQLYGGDHTDKSVIPPKGVLRSPMNKMPTGITSVGMAIRFKADAGKLRISRAGIRIIS